MFKLIIRLGALSLLLCLLNGVLARKVFTKEELAKYDGNTKGLPIYLAVKGVVFDVSSKPGFYGPGGSYHAMAGKDCTRAVAKWNVEEENLIPDVSDLSPKELEQLDNVFDKLYKAKYSIVGYMDYHKSNEDL